MNHEATMHEAIPRQPGPQQTRWSLVRRAANRGTPEGSAALDELLDLYLPAIDAYLVARSDVPPADAQDLRQSFVTERILEGSLLQSAQPEKGKFRSLLHKALANFVNTQLGRPANKRLVFVPPDVEFTPPVLPPASHAFDIAWANSVVSQAKTSARRFYEGRGQLQMWLLFEEHQSGSARERGRIKVLAAKYGCASEQDVSNLVVNVQRKLGTELRNVVRDTLDCPDEDAVDAEIRELIQILSAEESQPEFGTLPECKNPDAEA